MDFGRHLDVWDELMHWGKTVKQMLRLDRFYCVPESTMLWHKDYPPFISLFEYFWCVFSRGYSDMGIRMSIHVFQLSLIVPILFEEREMGKKIPEKILRGILTAILYVAVIFFLDQYGTFDTIYTDNLVGIMFAFTMYWIWSKEAYKDFWGYLTLCLALISLIHVKQIGIAYMLVAYFYFVLIGYRKPIRFKKIALGLLPALLCGAGYLIWSKLIASYNIQGQFNLKGLTLNSVLDVIKGGGAQHDTFKKYKKR